MAGRPTKYKPEYPEALVKHMAGGLSFETFAALCNVCRDTLYEWTDAHAEFSDAKKMGEIKSRLFWERLGLNAALGEVKNFNPTVWIYTMKCRFPKQWGDKQEVAHVIDDKREIKKVTNDELKRMLLEVDESTPN
jgi:hypothetical protein